MVNGIYQQQRFRLVFQNNNPLSKTAIKALFYSFKLENKIMGLHFRHNVEIPLKLFDTLMRLVKPILLYGSEISSYLGSK